MQFNKLTSMNVFFLVCVGMVLVTIAYFNLKPSQYDIEIRKAYEIKKSHPELTVFDGFQEPPIPDNNENNKTLLGIDSNNNGIRDDVEIWINRTKKDSNLRNALRQLNRTYQKIMTIGPNVDSKSPDSDKANKYYTEEYEARTCLRALLADYDKWDKEYSFFNKFIQNNTSTREKKYITGADQLTTSIGGPGLGNQKYIKVYCKFKVEN